MEGHERGSAAAGGAGRKPAPELTGWHVVPPRRTPTADLAPTARVISYRSDIGVALLRGALDLTAGDELRDVLARLGEPVAILDLTAVEILSASCLGLIVEDAAGRQARGGALALVAADGLALRILRVTGADTWIPTFSSLSDAVRESSSWSSTRR